MDIISIIIPCYNCKRYVVETIESVKSQSSDRWECIIVDDGSTDGSGDLIDHLVGDDGRFTVIHTENRGVAHARNIAIEKASGKYILPLDADDLLRSHTIETFLRYWNINPKASLLVPRVLCFRGEEVKLNNRTWKGYEALKEKCSPANSYCFKRADWERVGGYRDGTMYEDWEFWLRLLHHNDAVVNIPEILIRYRVRNDSRYHVAKQKHGEEVEIIRSMNPKIYGI